MMMPPMKVTQRAAPHEVAKQSRWASLATEAMADADSGRDPKRSGANTTPTAKKATAVRNRVDQAITGGGLGLGLRGKDEKLRI